MHEGRLSYDERTLDLWRDRTLSSRSICDFQEALGKQDLAASITVGVPKKRV
jgi:hypothetical protein